MTKPKTDTQVQSQQSISRPVSLQIRPQPAGTSEKILEKNMNKLLLWLYGETPEFVPVQAPSLPPKPQIQKNITSNTNDVDEITKGMADMSLNIVKMAKSKKSKTHKVKDAEAPPLASVPISKKEKQSLKSSSQNEQS
ncbi:16760_t:CDS:2, partial [Gigaspora rosea]